MLGGVITNFARKYTKRGDQMAVFVLEDLESSIEVTVFPKTLTEYGHILADDVIVAVRGRVDRRDETRVGFMAQKLEVIENLTMTGPRTVRMKLAASAVDEDTIDRLKAILTEFPGDAPVILDMGPGKVLQLADAFSVNIDKAIGDLRVAFGDAVIVG
jgi:DNA polymerase-3 subunit alpha